MPCSNCLFVYRYACAQNLIQKRFVINTTMSNTNTLGVIGKSVLSWCESGFIIVLYYIRLNFYRYYINYSNIFVL